MRMVHAHGTEEHVNKLWKRTDVYCLDTQATCLREVWIIEFTCQGHIRSLFTFISQKILCVLCEESSCYAS